MKEREVKRDYLQQFCAPLTIYETDSALKYYFTFSNNCIMIFYPDNNKTNLVVTSIGGRLVYSGYPFTFVVHARQNRP